MRELNWSDIKKRVKKKGTALDDAVNRFRIQSKQDGWSTKRVRPRHPDEMKALNLIARQTMLNALKSGQVVYDKESRVLRIERLEKLSK